MRWVRHALRGWPARLERTRRRRTRLLVATAVIGASGGATASAATITSAPLGDEQQITSTLRITDDQGVDNAIRITQDGAALVIEDLASEVEGCMRIDAHRARCLGSAAGDVSVRLGDGDDTLVVIAEERLSVHADGGTGDDRIQTGDGPDFVQGGPGSDELHAGAGNDSVSGEDGSLALAGSTGAADLLDGGPGTDSVTYRHPSLGLTADLAGTPPTARLAGVVDRLSSIEAVYSGPGPDVLRGDAGANVLDAGLGRNDVFGGAGDDVVSGTGSLDAGAGDDVVRSRGAAQVACGAGTDRVRPRIPHSDPTLARDCERLSLGVPGSLFTLNRPQVDPSPHRAGRALSFRVRCRLRPSRRQRCRVHLRVRDRHGRQLGSARRTIAARQVRDVHVRISSVIPAAGAVRVLLRLGAARGSTRLTTWRTSLP